MTNHLILALAAHNNWEVHQMDIKNAYLNAKLTEEIYMEQPPSFATSGYEHLVCKPLMALYSLKQAGQLWYARICKAFFKFRFKWCQSENCIFY